MQSNRFLFGPTYWLLWLGVALVYAVGLFVPLFDSDPAHHAMIALHMAKTGDFVDLMDRGRDYLDKPHWLFWTAALSFKAFGVTSFSFKIPSLLGSILGFYSTYRLGKLLYDEETGRLAALIHATAYAQFLANMDVRMDAFLTAFVVFSVWMLVAFVQSGSWLYLIGSGLALALGFATKGGIGLVMPLLAVGIYLLYDRNWKAIFQWKWVGLILFTGIFISPILFCYYLQFDQHPEKVVRGMTNISGIKFILLGQSVERFQGDAWGKDGSNDHFFFFHTMLWAFLPWSFMSYWALIRSMIRFKALPEMLTLGIIVVMLTILSFSQFKLPHYLNLLFPFMSIQLSSQLFSSSGKTIHRILIGQIVVVVLMFGIAIFLNGFMVPVAGIPNQIVAVLVALGLLIVAFLQKPAFLRMIALSVAGIVIAFMGMNANFYPQLFRYDAGYEFAKEAKQEPQISESFDLYRITSYTFDYYTNSIHRPYLEGSIPKGRWIMTDSTGLTDIRKANIPIVQIRSTPHFHLTMLNGEFLNPETRLKACEKRYLIETNR
ncbi:MAG: glycosyltransferase family 39 protein [Siphonobacter sp.]